MACKSAITHRQPKTFSPPLISSNKNEKNSSDQCDFHTILQILCCTATHFVWQVCVCVCVFFIVDFVETVAHNCVHICKKNCLISLYLLFIARKMHLISKQYQLAVGLIVFLKAVVSICRMDFIRLNHRALAHTLTAISQPRKQTIIYSVHWIPSTRTH